MTKQKLCAFTLRIPEELKIRLDIIAEKEDRSTNSLITVILKDFIEKENKKNKAQN